MNTSYTSIDFIPTVTPNLKATSSFINEALGSHICSGLGSDHRSWKNVLGFPYHGSSGSIEIFVLRSVLFSSSSNPTDLTIARHDMYFRQHASAMFFSCCEHTASFPSASRHSQVTY